MITITDSAAVQVKEIIAKEAVADHRLRLGVVGGGCSGLEYYIGLDKDIGEDDKVYPHNGFELVVDNESMIQLDGVTLDFANDFNNSGFIFSNPNASRTCGCGKSFCG